MPAKYLGSEANALIAKLTPTDALSSKTFRLMRFNRKFLAKK
jgi:hypothetical protein